MQALKDAVETSGTFMLIIAIAGFFTWIITKEGLATVLQDTAVPSVFGRPGICAACAGRHIGHCGMFYGYHGCYFADNTHLYANHQ